MRGTRIAMRLYQGGKPTEYWLLTDHRGLLTQPCSQSITANADGSLNSEVRYKAFGETRYTSQTETPTDYLFTGQRIEEEAGLYYYHARFYDPVLSHFVQADTLVSNNDLGGTGKSNSGNESANYLPLLVNCTNTAFLDQVNKENQRSILKQQKQESSVPTNSLSFDRYTYTQNNPLRYIDPDGHFALLVPLLIGATIGGIVSTSLYVISENIKGEEITLGGALGAFAGGAIGGAVSVIATPLAGTLLSSVGVAATGTALTAGSIAIEATGSAVSYFAQGYTQNAVDSAMGITPTFQPNLGDLGTEMAFSVVCAPIADSGLDISPNTMRTIKQANHFMPGRTFKTLTSTQNAQNLYRRVIRNSIFDAAF